MRDFTLRKYVELCEALIEKYQIITVEKYLRDESRNKVAILRHDVDKAPKRALDMAKIERDMGIFSTYYFRMVKGVFDRNIIREISRMGHEIGYHYEVVDKAKGDLDLAIKIFEKELQKFREIVDVKTLCMHGNPLTPWDNRILWSKYNFKKYDIIGEAYLSINSKDLIYLSDTGRNWSEKYSLKDKFKNSIPLREKTEFKSTDEVINFLKNQNGYSVYITTHPNRWCDDMYGWLLEFLSQNIKNFGKGVLIHARRIDS